MKELRVLIESLAPVGEEQLSAWFTLPIDADFFEERLKVGLSIAKELVNAHKGTINVASTPNFETTFTITLPKAL